MLSANHHHEVAGPPAPALAQAVTVKVAPPVPV